MMWVPSFISRSKGGEVKKRKWHRIAAGILAFVLTMVAITACMNYLYVDDTDEFARYMLHDFYTLDETENIDRLYLGSSHVFCDINPVILDEINGEYNYNLSTGTQQMITSYYLLKEADKKHDIKRVYLDLYYECTTDGLGNFRDYGSLPYSFIVLNQMKPSLNKLSYILNLSEPKYYYMSFFAFTRYKEQLFQPDYVAGVVERKQTDIYKSYQYEHIDKTDNGENVLRSAQKGYMIYDTVPEVGGFCSTEVEKPMGENPLTEETLEYLLKIVEYCKEQGIILTCIGCPISDFQLLENGTYDMYVSQIRSLAQEYGFAYYDFNLCKEEYLDVADDCYWADMGHLNTTGAEKFSIFLGTFLLAEEKGESTYQDCFYSSYEEKTAAMDEQIFGLEILQKEKSVQETEVGEAECVTYTIRPISNVSQQSLEVLVWKNPDCEEGNSGELTNNVREPLSVTQEDNVWSVTFPVDEHGTFYVEAGFAGQEVTNWAEISY